MDDVLDVLRADHERIAALLAILRGDPAEPSETRRRGAIREQLVAACSKHEALEEMILWPEVRRRLIEGGRLASMALDQEEIGKRLLDELDETDTDDEEFVPLVRLLDGGLRRHMRFEEDQVFSSLSRVLPGEDTAALARRVDAARRLAPSRPGAATRAAPRMVRIAAPLMGAFDHGRDPFSGRG